MSLLPAIQNLVQQAAPAPAPAPAPTLGHREGDAKAPTPFTGEDHSKLRDFLFECNLIFDVKPFTYAMEKSRVLYTIQHLDGIAKRHFRRYIEAGSGDPKVNRWRAFSAELEDVFGDPDQLGKASDQLLSLKMKETGKVHRYTVQFKEAADELGWPDIVLHRLYYNGLPNRIKDLWSRSDPPSDFNDLIREAQRADTRYWKRVDEKKAETAPTRSEPAQSSNPSSSSSRHKNSKRSQPSHSSHPHPSIPSTSQSQSKPHPSPSKPRTKDLSNLIGSDGKLVPEEKARREKLGLCLYCGNGHATDTCPKKAPRPPNVGQSPFKPTSAPSPSKLTHNTPSGSRPKGRVAKVVEPIADSDSESPADDPDF